MKKVLTSLAKYPLYIISLLPFPLLYLMADLLYAIIYYAVGYRRKVVQSNLRNAYPDKTDAEIYSIEKKFYHWLSDMILESVKMASMSPRTIKKRFRLNNPELISSYFSQGKPVLLVTAHYGNWEWGSLVLSANFREPLIIVYKPLTDKTFEGMMNHVRSRFGAIMVPMKQTLRKIVNYRSSTFWAVFLGDQTPVRQEAHYFTRFLNQRTPVFLGIEKIAKMTNAPVVFGHLNRVKRGYYEATFSTLSEDPASTAEYEITEAHTRLLEKIINERPELWLWSHKRWKNSY